MRSRQTYAEVAKLIAVLCSASSKRARTVIESPTNSIFLAGSDGEGRNLKIREHTQSGRFHVNKLQKGSRRRVETSLLGGRGAVQRETNELEAACSSVHNLSMGGQIQTNDCRQRQHSVSSLREDSTAFWLKGELLLLTKDTLVLFGQRHSCGCAWQISNREVVCIL